MRSPLLIALALAAPVLGQTDHPVPSDPRWLTFSGAEGPGAGKHIVLVAADQEYRSEESLPMLARTAVRTSRLRLRPSFSA